MDKTLKILSYSLNTEEYFISVKEPPTYGERLLLHPTLMELFELFAEKAAIICQYRDIRWGPGWCGLTIEWAVVKKQKTLTFKQWKDLSFQEEGLDAHVSTIPFIPAKDLNDFFLHILLSKELLEELYWKKHGSNGKDGEKEVDKYDEREVISALLDTSEEHDSNSEKGQRAEDNGEEEEDCQSSNGSDKDEGPF
ncbi:hypothetical protein GG344DRAFT_83321 [Lentinula edodes]|nr:hypothetical protein GG344DRAFT_83321 [Lentinula edodes]